MKIFLPHSGNLGDTSAILPVLSGYYKDTGRRVSLIVRDKMKQFKGIKELYEAQDGIDRLYFESDGVEPNRSVCLSDRRELIDHRPSETQRYQISFNSLFGTSCDDAFELKVPQKYLEMDLPDLSKKLIVADRVQQEQSDTRRKFGLLTSLQLDNAHYLDINDDIGYNLALIKSTVEPILGTFTGIAVLCDLMWKNQLLLYSQDLWRWDGTTDMKDLFRRHFYTNRKTEYQHFTDFLLNRLIDVDLEND